MRRILLHRNNWSLQFQHCHVRNPPCLRRLRMAFERGEWLMWVVAWYTWQFYREKKHIENIEKLANCSAKKIATTLLTANDFLTFLDLNSFTASPRISQNNIPATSWQIPFGTLPEPWQPALKTDIDRPTEKDDTDTWKVGRCLAALSFPVVESNCQQKINR